MIKKISAFVLLAAITLSFLAVVSCSSEAFESIRDEVNEALLQGSVWVFEDIVPQE